MRRRSSFLPFITFALLGAALYLYFSPYLALRKLQRAADAGDVVALNEVVDFPALRTSLKENAQSAVDRGISERAGRRLGALGGLLAGVLVKPVADVAVTPAGISALTRGRDPSDGERRGDDGDGWRDRLDRKFGYESTSRFVVRYVDRESGEERVGLVLLREGLDWKLSAVRFGAQPR